MVVSSCVAITKAFGTRIMFGAHSLLVVWRVTDVTGNWHHWFFLLANVLLFIELLYTCIKRKGQEWKWYKCKVVFINQINITCMQAQLWFILYEPSLVTQKFFLFLGQGCFECSCSQVQPVRVSVPRQHGARNLHARDGPNRALQAEPGQQWRRHRTGPGRHRAVKLARRE